MVSGLLEFSRPVVRQAIMGIWGYGATHLMTDGKELSDFKILFKTFVQTVVDHELRAAKTS